MVFLRCFLKFHFGNKRNLKLKKSERNFRNSTGKRWLDQGDYGEQVWRSKRKAFYPLPQTKRAEEHQKWVRKVIPPKTTFGPMEFNPLALTPCCWPRTSIPYYA